MPTSKGVEIKTEGYVIATPPPTAPAIITPSGVAITAEGYVVAPTIAEKQAITQEIKKQYPQLKPDEVVTVSYTLPDQKTVTYFLGDKPPEIIKPPESVKLMGVELPEGGFKDFMLGLRHALEVDESKLTGELFGIKNPELERSAAQINKFFDVFAPKVEAPITEPVEFIKETAFVTATFIPILGTALTWKDNSDVGRAVNILIDIAILAPFAKAGVRNIRANFDPFKAAAKQHILTERVGNRQLANRMSRTYGKSVGDNFMAFDKAQANYIEQLVKLEKLKSAKHPNAVRIAKANNVAENLARDLKTATTKYVSSVKGKAGFDSPTVAKMIDDLPNEVVHNARSAVEGLKPKKVNIKKLKTDVARADANLQKLQLQKAKADASVKTLYDKWISEGQPKGELRSQLARAREIAQKADNKWLGAMADQAYAQSKLEQVVGKSMVELHNDLIQARAKLTKAKAYPKATTKAGRLEQYKNIQKLEAEVSTLEDKLNQAVKSAEVKLKAITDKEGNLIKYVTGDEPIFTGSRGGVSTLTRVSPKAPVITGAGAGVKPKVKPATVDAISAASLARIRGDYELKPAEIEKIEPMVTTTLSPLEKTISKSTPEVIAEVERLSVTALQHATDLVAQNKTITEIRLAVENELRNKIQAITDPALRTQLQTKLKIMTQVAVKTAVKIGTKLKLKPKISIRIPTPDGSRLLTPAEIAGSVAWKQGFIYKLIYPPYGKHNIIHSTKPFPGVKVAKGARSAYESIVRIGGKLPRTIKRDMGVMDIYIYTPKKRKAKPRLKFRRDPKQRTRITPTLSTTR